MSLESTCDAHDWSWDPTDDYGCPVCYGISLEQERITALLEGMVGNMDGNYSSPKEVYGAVLDAIALIKGENNAE